MTGAKYRRIVYVSTAVESFTKETLVTLAEGSAARNAAVDITGILLYKGSTFLQVIEGPVASISGLLERIELDDRHTFIEILLDEPTSRRMFKSWDMQLLNLEQGAPPSTIELLSVARFLTKCQFEDSSPVVQGFIRHFTDGSTIFLDAESA